MPLPQRNLPDLKIIQAGKGLVASKVAILGMRFICREDVEFLLASGVESLHDRCIYLLLTRNGNYLRGVLTSVLCQTLGVSTSK